MKKDGSRDKFAEFTLDSAKKPAHLNIQEKGEQIPAIYELKETERGVELTIAFAIEGGRPKDFKGEGKDEVLIRLLRKKE